MVRAVAGDMHFSVRRLLTTANLNFGVFATKHIYATCKFYAKLGWQCSLKNVAYDICITPLAKISYIDLKNIV